MSKSKFVCPVCGGVVQLIILEDITTEYSINSDGSLNNEGEDRNISYEIYCLTDKMHRLSLKQREKIINKYLQDYNK